MCFAGDLLLFSRGDITSINALCKIFQKFSASGFIANKEKSCCYLGGMKDAEKIQISQHFGFKIDELPFKYLNIPFSTRKLTILQWNPVIDKIIARVSSWTAKKLSYAGRVQLVQ